MAIKMTSRERVLAALDHREPDKAPIDLGGVVTTSISGEANEKLKAHLGVDGIGEYCNQPALDVYVPGHAILELFEVDFRAVRMRPPSPTNDGRQSWFVPDEGKAIKGDHFFDEFGNRWQLAEFDYAPAGPPSSTPLRLTWTPARGPIPLTPHVWQVCAKRPWPCARARNMPSPPTSCAAGRSSRPYGPAATSSSSSTCTGTANSQKNCSTRSPTSTSRCGTPNYELSATSWTWSARAKIWARSVGCTCIPTCIAR